MILRAEQLELELARPGGISGDGCSAHNNPFGAAGLSMALWKLSGMPREARQVVIVGLVLMLAFALRQAGEDTRVTRLDWAVGQAQETARGILQPMCSLIHKRRELCT